MIQNNLLSWGNYPFFPQVSHRCFWRDALIEKLSTLHLEVGSTLPFGNGRSYGDSCLAASGHVISLKALDRFISADWKSGRIVAEAGIMLDQILRIAIPHGWFLTVTPGTKFTTLGGAIANDVHGKNHHIQGTFGRHVKRLSLLRSEQGRLTCSPEENSELFCATIGGLGLTGIIEWADIQLTPIRSSRINCTLERFNSLSDFFTLAKELDKKHEFGVAWVDCIAKGKNIGRGVYMAGDFAQDDYLQIKKIHRPINIPITPPISLINGFSLRAFNGIYWHRQPKHRKFQQVCFESFFFPLDRILNWNRIYGCKGFSQYQCLIPEKHAETAIQQLLNTIAKSGSGSFLAVLKRFGNLSSPGWLSFPGPGTTLTLDFPRNTSLLPHLFNRLDTIVREAGGRHYPAKDTHVSGEDFRRCFPAWKKIEALRDPALKSRFWDRVTS